MFGIFKDAGVRPQPFIDREAVKMNEHHLKARRAKLEGFITYSMSSFAQ